VEWLAEAGGCWLPGFQGSINNNNNNNNNNQAF
jgi:hypothetical protein